MDSPHRLDVELWLNHSQPKVVILLAKEISSRALNSSSDHKDVSGHQGQGVITLTIVESYPETD
jgi:hypothetical protein